MSKHEQQGSNQQLNVEIAFCEAILDLPPADSHSLNASETELCVKISEMLEQANNLANFVPVLPVQLVKFLDELEKDNTDFEKLCEIIKEDIALAGETLRVANSPFYRVSQSKIESIDRAVSCLGLEGVTEIAMALVAKQVMDVESSHYENFGDLLWRHCQECAEVSKLLCEPEADDSFASFLLGLIHDVGKVAIFACLCEHFTKNPSRGINEGKVLRQVITDHSTWLSAHIAKEWNLPDSIVLALYEFNSRSLTSFEKSESFDKSPLAQLLGKANSCAEIFILLDRQAVDPQTCAELIHRVGLDPQELDCILKRYQLLAFKTA